MNTMKSTATLVALLALATTAQATPVLHLQIGTDAPTSTATGLDGANLHLKSLRASSQARRFPAPVERLRIYQRATCCYSLQSRQAGPVR